MVTAPRRERIDESDEYRTADDPDQRTESYEPPTDRDDETPEADGAEQSRPTDDVPAEEPRLGPEVDEADAVEQAHAIADPDDDYRG